MKHFPSTNRTFNSNHLSPTFENNLFSVWLSCIVFTASGIVLSPSLTKYMSGPNPLPTNRFPSVLDVVIAAFGRLGPFNGAISSL